jgi:fatty-acyl-CoA synthase
MVVPDTLTGMLGRLAAEHPGAVAISEMGGRSLTYAELLEQSERVASGLAGLGLARGDTLATWLDNCVEWLVLEFAAARLGVLVVALNPRYKVNEVSHLLGVAASRVLVMRSAAGSHDYGARLDEAVAEAGDQLRLERIVLLDADSDWRPTGGLAVTGYRDLAVAERAGGEPAGRPEDLINVFGTSGTTSFPKLAGHDQRAVVRHAYDGATALEYGAGESLLAFLPFCGAYGFIAMTSMLAVAGRVVVMPAYSVDAAIDAVAAEGITSVFALEAVFRELFASPRAQAGALASWRTGGIAGLTVEPVVRRAEDEFGIRLTNLYGSSELFALMACWHPSDSVEQRSVAGGRMVSEGMQARAVDPTSREVLPEGSYGELEFAGFNVTSGYLSNPQADALAFSSDGWYRSGDHGAVLDGGRTVHYTARLADTLRLRGYLVSPTEIEELVASHGSVSDVAVVGVPLADTGDERAVAFVRHENPPADLEDQIRDHIRSRAASWKVPDAVVAVREFPTTPGANGDKVQKSRLREMAIEHLSGRLVDS